MSTPTAPPEVGSSPKPEFVTTKKPSMISIDELVKIMEANTLQDDPREKRTERSSKLVKAYLIKNEPEFVRVMGFRDRGWMQNKDKGDAFFKAQRERADNADVSGEQKFFRMMIQIADEMNGLTGALSPQTARGPNMKVLDICMAPGGYTAAVLKFNPRASTFAITLPKDQGGHPIHIERSRLAGLQLLDVTMLVNEYTDKPIPPNHPDREKFLTIRPFRFHSFDLVFCDGMVLRTQQREDYREKNEVIRLSTSQLILAMQRIKPGGTLVMLLHKIDSFPAANILHIFSKFAKVEAFKPQKKHATRSSFYMIAKDVQAGHEAAKAVVEEWREAWWKATFGGETGTGEPKLDPPESVVLNMLEEFGEQLMEMGRPVWRTQGDALSRTEYAGDGSIVRSDNAVGLSNAVKPSPWRDLRESLKENVPLPNSRSPVGSSSWRALRENVPPQSTASPITPSPWDVVRESLKDRVPPQSSTSPTPLNKDLEDI
ncbi:hypothetical protein LCER1_G004590 [Lachnellula cervina]|uniref:Ribosomal RNA methyltransferase FtsJ domain-containing protein n=1 Tax=Lachnellula cervina TaxID=1316786 RepID=A0A7D8URP3_9HELO|nr:hypothetical protein LCER1_G004590 [Lachnellula cervina]